jgi:uncharacterized protein (TIGR03000 family)
MRSIGLSFLFVISLSDLSAADATGTAAVTVQVPVGATLFINGQPTSQMTSTRKFVTPALLVGKRYRYNLEATYTWNGEELTKKYSIEVTAGGTITVDLTKGETVVKPPPPPEPEVKPEPKPEPKTEPKPEPKPVPKPKLKPMPEPKKPESKPEPVPPPDPPAPRPEPPRPQPKPKPGDNSKSPPANVDPPRPPAPPPRELKPKKGK